MSAHSLVMTKWIKGGYLTQLVQLSSFTYSKFLLLGVLKIQARLAIGTGPIGHRGWEGWRYYFKEPWWATWKLQRLVWRHPERTERRDLISPVREQETASGCGVFHPSVNFSLLSPVLPICEIALRVLLFGSEFGFPALTMTRPLAETYNITYDVK